MKVLNACLLAGLCVAGTVQARTFDIVQRDYAGEVYVGAGGGYGYIEPQSQEEDSGTSGKLFAGYFLSDIWALEVAARKNEDLDANPVKNEDGFDHNFSAGISLLGYAHYDEFSAFYRLGGEYIDYDQRRVSESGGSGCRTATASLYLCEDSESEWGILVGLGMEHRWNKSMGYRLEWESSFGQSEYNSHMFYLSFFAAY